MAGGLPGRKLRRNDSGSARPHTTAYMQIGFYRAKIGGTYTYYSLSLL
jgi:hypothetical protein